MKPKTYLLVAITLFAFAQLNLHAQDSVVRVNGTYIFGKVSTIGNNQISYKKSGMEDGPTYTEDLRNVAYVRYKNGTKEVYAKSSVAPVKTDVAKNNTSNTKLPGSLEGSTTQPEGKTPEAKAPEAKMPDNPMLANGPVSNQYRIEHLDKKFTVNGEKVSQKAVDKLLGKSNNPAVVAMAKTAKLTKTFQKITKITSYPSTIGGGIASISTFSRMYEQIQDSGASFNSCKDFGLSFLGTMALPITSKILKNRRDKLYDKAIDLYNISN